MPDEFTMNLNHRFPPGTSIQEAQRTIEALVGGRAEITWRDLSPSAPPHAWHLLVVALREAGVAAVEPKQAWTDVARFAELGVPAVNFGPGENAQAHQRNEWSSLQKLSEGRAILRRWLSALGPGSTPRAHPPRASVSGGTRLIARGLGSRPGDPRALPVPARTESPAAGIVKKTCAAPAGRARPRSYRRGPPRCPW